MGFDAFGPTQVPRPSQQTDTSSFFADLARKQRADDRAIGDTTGLARIADRTPSSQISTGTLDGSGIGSASYVVPSLGASFTWVQMVADVSCALSGDDAELWISVSGASTQNHEGYGKQPPVGLGTQAVGAITASRVAPGATISLGLYCPIEAGESYTVTFSASPSR
jgi:hypothetical protein